MFPQDPQDKIEPIKDIIAFALSIIIAVFLVYIRFYILK